MLNVMGYNTYNMPLKINPKHLNHSIYLLDQAIAYEEGI